jgi:hypothetical protein
MIRDARGRLTPVDIVFYGVALFTAALFAEPWYSTLRGNAGQFGAGEAYIFQLIYPAFLITLMSMVYLTAASGGST